MTTPSPDNPPPTILPYATPRPTLIYKPQSDLLLAWQILNIIAAPPGLLIGVVGTFATISNFADSEMQLWNIHSPEDWLAFLLWLPIALGFITLPIIFAIRCGILRRQLALGDPSALARAAHLCTLAHRYSALLALGLLVGFAKAFLHSRHHEFVWWILLIIALGLYIIAVDYTRREMKRILKFGPDYLNPRLTANPL